MLTAVGPHLSLTALVAICGPVARGNSLCAANAGHGT